MIYVKNSKMALGQTQRLELTDNHTNKMDLSFWQPQGSPFNRNPPVRIDTSNLEGIKAGDLFADLPSLIAFLNKNYNMALDGFMPAFNIDPYEKSKALEIEAMYKHLGIN